MVNFPFCLFLRGRGPDVRELFWPDHRGRSGVPALHESRYRQFRLTTGLFHLSRILFSDGRYLPAEGG